jgi:SNF2 family DNA or RNA helicase
MDLYLDWVSSRGLDSKDYQYNGVEWCMKAEQREKACGPRGGFLADEMGLGKTITMIGLGFASPVERTLIVLPAALVEQWKAQLRKLDGRKILVWHKGIKIDHLLQIPVVITTYGKIGVTEKRKVCDLHKVEWGRIIFDEAHHLRNRKTGGYMGAKLLQGRAKWLVTGTPIQNRTGDLKCLCAVLGVAASKMDKDLIQDIKREYILRRTKESVNLSLPELKQEEIFVSWADDGEEALANDVHSSLPFCNVERNLTDPVHRSHSFVNIFDTGDAEKLIMMMKALQICAFPALLKQDVDYALERNELDEDHPYVAGVRSKSKLDSLLTSLLTSKNNGNGKLVFCRFHKEIDFLAHYLREKGMDAVVFDGRVSLGARRNILKRPHDVLIMQIQAGCEGLNLQEHYSEIYFVSPHWNPAIEDQAIARCHRLGQQKEVNIYHYRCGPGAEPPASLPGAEPTASLPGAEPPASLTIDQYIVQTQKRKREYYI